jgi:hypothetical protein
MPSPIMADTSAAALQHEFETALDAARTPAALKALRDDYLSRKNGRVTALVKSIATAPLEERRVLGATANTLKQHIEQAIDAREAALIATARPKDALDVTLPARRRWTGRRHPLTQVRERVEDIFMAMGYQVIEGPEIEDDWHNFEALNMPASHPARDMQDTLYLSSPVAVPDEGRAATLLRTHTSGEPPELVGFSYWVASAAEPNGFAGPNDKWHAHQGMCFIDSWLRSENVEVRNDCADTWIDGSDLWMLHAWPVPGSTNRWGPFADMNPSLCGAPPNTPDILKCNPDER